MLRFLSAALVAFVLHSPSVRAAECKTFTSVREAIKESQDAATEAAAAVGALPAAREGVIAALDASGGASADRNTAGRRAADSALQGASSSPEFVEAVRLVRALFEAGKPKDKVDAVEKKLTALGDALEKSVAAQKGREGAERCLNTLFGIGPGHVNTIVLVGDESKFGYVESPLDPEWDEEAKKAAKRSRKAGTKAPPAADGASEKSGVSLLERLRGECLSGVDIRRLGVSTGLANLTRVEGLSPFLDRASPDDGKPRVSLTPGRAVLVLAAEYEGVWPDAGANDQLRLKCVRLMHLGQARLTELQLGTYGFGSDSQNRIDLLKGPLAKRVTARLRDAMYVGIPVRKVMRYQTSRAAEDVLMDGQEVELTVVRARTALENDRTPAPAGSEKVETFETLWSFDVASMPRAILRLPVIAGLAITDEPKAGDKPVWLVGPAVALSYRVPLPQLGRGRYLAGDVFLNVASRIGESEVVPKTLVGGGVQLDLFGYLGLGVAYMGDVRFTQPTWVFTITPVPWITHALGLEKTFD